MLPWKETNAESERMRFIELKATGVETVADLCRWFGISRKTAYKLIGRYEAHGRDGLRDRSRAPHRHANATPRDVAERIVKAKRAHPSWGPKKLVAWLRSREPDAAWPAPSTASGILDRGGLVKRRKRRRRYRPGQPLSAGRLVGQAGYRPRAHRAGTARTERAPRATPPHSQGGDGVTAHGQPEKAAVGLRPPPSKLQL